MISLSPLNANDFSYCPIQISIVESLDRWTNGLFVFNLKKTLYTKVISLDEVMIFFHRISEVVYKAVSFKVLQYMMIQFAIQGIKMWSLFFLKYVSFNHASCTKLLHNWSVLVSL